MKALLVVLCLFPALSHAANYQMRLGQHANLQAGDQLTITGPGGPSMVSCGGGNQPPSYYDFVQKQLVDLSQDFQGRPEDNARSLCELGIDPSGAAQRLLDRAKNDCIASYSNCAQLGKTEYTYVGKDRNNGKHGCFIKVVVRGQ